MDSTPSILSIATDDDPILKIPAIAVDIETLSCCETQQIINNMIATMYAANGIGLAAPQVKISLRIMVFYLPPSRDDVHGVGVSQTVLINPTVDLLDGEKVCDFEGCLSVPGFRGKVSRAKRIRYTGYSEKGDFVDRMAEGWHARLVQHEFDHLNGILYPELMAEEDRLLTIDEWKSLPK